MWEWRSLHQSMLHQQLQSSFLRTSRWEMTISAASLQRMLDMLPGWHILEFCTHAPWKSTCFCTVFGHLVRLQCAVCKILCFSAAAVSYNSRFRTLCVFDAFVDGCLCSSLVVYVYMYTRIHIYTYTSKRV